MNTDLEDYKENWPNLVDDINKTGINFIVTQIKDKVEFKFDEKELEIFKKNGIPIDIIQDAAFWVLQNINMENTDKLIKEFYQIKPPNIE